MMTDVIREIEATIRAQLQAPDCDFCGHKQDVTAGIHDNHYNDCVLFLLRRCHTLLAAEGTQEHSRDCASWVFNGGGSCDCAPGQRERVCDCHGGICVQTLLHQRDASLTALSARLRERAQMRRDDISYFERNRLPLSAANAKVTAKVLDQCAGYIDDALRAEQGE